MLQSFAEQQKRTSFCQNIPVHKGNDSKDSIMKKLRFLHV
jgi:hypothetical protein